MKIFDTHTHVISPDIATYPTDPIGGHQSEWSQKRPVDADGLLKATDEAGIAKAVVVQASTVYGHDNRYVVDTVRANPSRFVGVYSIDALAPDAVEQIDHWQAQGLSGFRLFTTGSTMPGQSDWLGHKDSFAAWAHAETLGIPVCLQMTMEGLPALRALLERFPAADMVVGSRKTYPGTTAARRFVSWTNRALIGALFGTHFLDYNFVQIWKRSALAGQPRISTATSFITPEMIVRAHRRGLRVDEVEVDYHRREVGTPSSANSFRCSVRS